MHDRSRTKGHTMNATKTPRELIEAARNKYCWNATPANHQDLFHEYATTALSLLPSLLAAHDAEIAALKAAQPVGEPVAWGVWAEIDNAFILQYPVSDTRLGAQKHADMYSADQVLEIHPLYTPQSPSQPVEPAAGDARMVLIHSLVASKGWNHGYAAAFVDDWFHDRAQTAPAAPYQATLEDAEAFMAWLLIGGGPTPARLALQETIKQGLQAHEARKATA